MTKKQLREAAARVLAHVQQCDKCRLSRKNGPCGMAQLLWQHVKSDGLAVLNECIRHAHKAGPQDLERLARRVKQFVDVITQPKPKKEDQR